MSTGPKLFEQQPRWGIVPTLVWIATRNLELTAKIDSEKDGFHTAGVHLAIVKAFNKDQGILENWPLADIETAWTHHLVPKMANGSLAAFATKVTGRRTSSIESGFPGVAFPPADQPGAPFDYKVADRGGEPTLVHIEQMLHDPWTEFRNPTFDRNDVLVIWKSLVGLDESQSKNEQSLNRQYVPEPEIRDWFAGHVQDHPQNQSPPNREADYRSCVEHFHPRTVHSKRFYALRSTRGAKEVIPLSWRKQGKRAPNTKNK